MSSTLNLGLVNVNREQAAGAFSIDLVAEDEGGGKIIVENQLEKSNHDHLGKVLTYMVAMGARAAVWIVAEPRPEHVAVVAWLNDSSSADFYLVKVEAARQVLAYHLALERELLIVLARLVADARPFAKDSFGFAAKVDALESLWTFGGAWPLATALRRFNDLRNALAHGHSRLAIDKKEARLRSATIALVGGEHGLDWTIKGSAAYLMGYMNSPADDHLGLQ